MTAGVTAGVPRGGRPVLGVGVVGFGWMGRVHAQAYQRLLHHYPDTPLRPLVVAVADDQPARLADAAARCGVERLHEDWKAVVEDPDVQAVSVTAPNFLHREIGVAVARAGKHLWIEKPVGLSAADARAVAEAVVQAGVRSAVGFSYRAAPAVQHARDLLASGALGTVTGARVRFRTDYAASPRGALTWRFLRERGGDGVLGDLASHAVDLTRFLLGDLDALVATTGVAVPQRPLPATGTGGAGGYALGSADGPAGRVENADSVTCLARTRGGATVTLEASRVSVGDQNAYGFEVHATAGRLEWDFRRMGELLLTRAGEGGELDAPTVRLAVGPAHGEFGAFLPGAGIPLGFDDLKVVEAARFVRCVAAGRATPDGVPDDPGGPHGSDVAGDLATVDDAVASAVALEAMTTSAREARWVTVA